jgi:plasmid replication initiation protein
MQELNIPQISNPYLIVQDNEFINFRHTLTVQEARVFLSLVSQVDKNDADFKDYRIDVLQFIEQTGLKKKNIYSELKRVSTSLRKKEFRKENEDGSFLVSGYISSAEYRSGEGFVELTFDPKLKPYLLGLKTKFTQYDIRNILSLRSIFSILLFQLLKQFESVGERTMSLTDLKYKLSLDDKFKQYNDFKRYVLEIAQREIKENCDIYFDYEELREGRKVTSIKFIIHSQDTAREQIKLVAAVKRPEQKQKSGVTQDINFEEIKEQDDNVKQSNEPSVAMIQELGVTALLTPEQCNEILEYFDNDYVKTWESIKGFAEIKDKGQQIARPLAYIFKSKGLGAGSWEKQQEKVRVIKDKQTAELIKSIQEDYRKRREEQLILLYNEASEEQQNMAFEIIRDAQQNMINGRNIALDSKGKINTFGVLQAGAMFAEAQKKGADYRQPRYANYVLKNHNIHIGFDKNDEVVYLNNAE